MEKNKEVFKTKDKDGNEIELAIQSPSQADKIGGDLAYNRAWRQAVEGGSILRAKVEQTLREQNIWNDNLEKEYRDLSKELRDNLKKLRGGRMKLSEGKKLALDIKTVRAKMQDLLSERNAADEVTAEAFGDRARFNYLLTSCVVYNKDGVKYFKNVDDYINRSDEQASLDAARAFAYKTYGLEKDFEKSLPENKFLIDYRLVDDNMRWIDKDGNFVDSDGKRVDEEGRYINEEGKFVNADGELVDDDGIPVAEDFAPFLDDDGNPVVLKTDKVAKVEKETVTSK